MRLLPTMVLAAGALAAEHDFQRIAKQTFEELQTRYWDAQLGLWKSSMWWQTANTVESVANLALLVDDPDVKLEASAAIKRVFSVTSNQTIARCDRGVNLTFSGYFDDEEWWGLAWLRAHKLTGSEMYLNRSRAIFEDLAERAWSNASCGGGVCWRASRDPSAMNSCYKNAITNELFFSHAAQLSTLYASRCALNPAPVRTDCARAKEFAKWAERSWSWFYRSGMINGSGLVNDGLDTFAGHESVCLNNRRPAYTYNQGVLLSGLASLWAARRRKQSNNTELLRVASSIITAVWQNSSLTYAGSGGVLREASEWAPNGTVLNLYSGDPGTDGLQFKSVLIRHLRYLIDVIVQTMGSEAAAQKVVAEAGGNLSHWRAVVVRNGQSIWDRAACAPSIPLAPGSALQVPPLFGFLWIGPCSWAFGGPTATTQTAALDVFVASSF